MNPEDTEVGRRLGYYPLLFELGPVTVAYFSAAVGIAPRDARDWLEGQAAAGILDVAIPGDENTREYLLPGEHVPKLVD